ncbi:MAG TPA: FliM/FliN family flagellar motor switch protein [Polyangia bacterium]|nr:FliM/FliN family flagellar motor switch protein [Polyangia bacterium]
MNDSTNDSTRKTSPGNAAPLAILASALPRVNRDEASAVFGGLAALGALPERIEVDVPGLGRVALAIVGAAPARALDGPSFGLVRGAVTGRLSFAAPLARRLMTRVLGVDTDEVFAVRRLGLGERGLVAGLIARVLHALEASVDVSVVAPESDELRVARALAIDLEVDVAGLRGGARLELPPAWLEAAASSEAARARLVGMPFEVVVEVARTFLAARELARLEIGDAVVFGGVEAVDARARRSAWLVVGAHAAPVEIVTDGRVIVHGGFERVATAEQARAQEASMEMKKDGVPGLDATAVLAAAPVEIVAEVGRITLRGDEILGLTPGAVLGLGARSTVVALRVGGEVWAEGELVDVEGELGVRVTRTFRR